MVAGADAYLTQGQVRLTRLQQQLSTELGRHHDLEMNLAQLSNPTAVVSAAQQDGLQAPGQVTDLPLANR
jgi:cell division protein FtsL